MLDKLGGVYAPRPSTGPHKLRECLPLVIFLRNRLKYALTGNEVLKIVKQRLIKVDGKVRTDPTYPAGFMGKFCTSFKYLDSIWCMSMRIPILMLLLQLSKLYLFIKLTNLKSLYIFPKSVQESFKMNIDLDL